MRKYSERGFKNLEFLRFLLIFAVVGVHLAYLNLSSTEEYSWLVKWGAGWQAVEMFFLMSGFFLFYQLNTEETVLHFALRKWLRLAPFVIALTFIGYIATGFDIYQYPLSVNIFNSLLLLDWNTHHFGPDATILYVAWFVNVLFFVSVIYFCILKALKHEQANLVIGAISFICLFMYSRHMYIIVPFIYPLVRAFAYVGFGYLLSEIFKSYLLHKDDNSVQINLHSNVKTCAISIVEAILLIAIVISLYAGSTGVPVPDGLSIPPEQIQFLNAQTWFPDLTRWALGGVWLQLCFVGLFWLFLLNKGLVSRLLNNKFSVILGSYSYAIFLGHTIVIRAIKDYVDLQKISFVFEHNFIFVALLCLLIFIFAVIVHHLVEMPLIKMVSKILR